MERFDVAILGGGVTGTSAAFGFARYTNVQSIVMFERRHAVAQVNSNVMMNAQTLHEGPQETNYGLEKALKVNAGARLLKAYLDKYAPDACKHVQKMVIGVGKAEVAMLVERFALLKPHFPKLRLLDRDEIAALEPKVMEGRDPNVPIVALYTEDGRAVNYQRVAESFQSEAAKCGKTLDVFLNREVESITRVEGDDPGFVIKTNRGEIFAKAVSVCAGGSSLNFAHAMGLGKEYSLLAVAGSFYTARNLVNGKVYCVQDEAVPFAEPHADRAVHDPAETRLGPTASPRPMIERHRWSTVWEFAKSGALRMAAIWSLMVILSNSRIARFAFSQFLCELPFFGKWWFLRIARKIIPTLRYRDLKLARGEGGIRSQLVDTKTRKLAKGMDKIVDKGIIFTMAPSPGASYCLGNAVEDIETLIAYLGSDYRFDKDRLHADLFGVEDPAVEEGAVL